MEKKLLAILKHRLFQSTALVFSGSMVANVSAWLYQVFLGRILGSVKYGEISALFSLLYLLAVIGTAVGVVLVKLFSTYKAKGEIGQAKQLFHQATRNSLVSLGLGLILLLFFSKFLADFLALANQTDFLWLYLIFVFFLLGVINNSALQGFQKFREFSFFLNLGQVLRLGIGIWFSFWGVSWALVGNAFVLAIAYFLSFLPLGFLRREKTLRQKIEISSLGYGVQVFLATFGLTALFSQDILWVKHFFSPHQAGIYASVAILGKAIFYASSAVNMVIFPVIAERQVTKQSHQKIFWYGFSGIAALCLLLSLGYHFFSRFLILPFGSGYQEAIPYLASFGLFMTAYSLSSILTNALLALGKSGVWLILFAGALLQAIILSLLHTNLMVIILANTGVTALILVALLVYYLFNQREK